MLNIKAVKQRTKDLIVFLRFKKNLTQFIFLNFLLSSCCFKTSPPLDKVREEKVTAFFEELLLEYGGAYTLLGSKPATVEDLLDMSPENYKQLQEYLAAHPELEVLEIDRHLEDGWKILKQKPIQCSKRFVLTEVNCGDYDLLVFLNTELTIGSMKEYYSEFKRGAGTDFDPIVEIENLRLGKHDLWRRIFNDFVCQGILLGYGLENAKLFKELYSEVASGNLQNASKPSENNDPRLKAECTLNNKPFRIPIFAMFDTTESVALVAKYKNEREQIKKKYAGKNFLKETLSILKR